MMGVTVDDTGLNGAEELVGHGLQGEDALGWQVSLLDEIEHVHSGQSRVGIFFLDSLQRFSLHEEERDSMHLL